MYNMVGEMDAARVASHSANSTAACEVSSENSSWWWVLQRAVREVRIEVVIIIKMGRIASPGAKHKNLPRHYSIGIGGEESV